MILRTWTLAACIAGLALTACGSSGGGGGGATPGVDAGTVDSKTGDTVADGTGVDTGTPSDTGAGDAVDNKACCAAKKATCGFVSGCPGTCGSCGSGKTCNTSTHKCEVEIVLKKFGEACGPTADCRPPGNNATTAEQQAYRSCLNAQCDDGLCVGGVCTKTCVIGKDTKNNATGDAKADGIEDPDVTDSDCAGAVDGPAGSSFKCVQATAPGQQQYQLCIPGTTFKACKADSDCGPTEVCGYGQIYGPLRTACVPKWKNPDGKPGVGVSAACNNDPVTGSVAQCANNLCLKLGCVSFCKSDADCVTAPGACQGGKCPGGDACSSDADCSAWSCKKGQKFFGANDPPVDVCWPKTCDVDKDCKSSNFICLTSYNGVQSADGDPDPNDPSKVTMPAWSNACVHTVAGSAKKGDACDPYSSDADTSIPPCENPYWCTNGVCGSHCKTDGDCASNQKCGVVEIPLDLPPQGQPNDAKTPSYDVVLPLGVCDAMPGAAGACYSQNDCKDKGDASYCKPWEYVAPVAADATPTGAKYTTGGQCIKPTKGYKAMGELCGQFATKAGDEALCQSGLCFGQDTAKEQPGFCSDLCDGKATCPNKVTIGGQDYKTICRSVLYGWNGTLDLYDDNYLPVCWPTTTDSSLTDCSKDKTCGKGENCLPFAIATGPDKAAKMEFLCLKADAKQGTKKVGESCNSNPPSGTASECASGFCIDDGAGKGTGYCSAMCNADADCGTTTDGMMCDTGHMYIARKDPTKAGYLPLCLKKKSCLPCAVDAACVGSYRCTNLAAAGKDPNGRCAPPCSSDADCKATDAGSKCEAAKDAKGKEIAGVKVCTPSCK